MIKAAFFDIDGTLLYNTTNFLIPQSTKDAIAELHRKGIKVCICSGRPKAQLPPCIKEGFEGLEGGFDAYILMTGSLCYDKDGVYSEVPIERPIVERFYDLVKAGEFDSLALDREAVFCNAPKSDIVRKLEQFVNYTYPEYDFAKVLEEPIYQFCAFVPPEKDDYISSLVGDCIVTRWCDIFCDIVPSSSSKPAGIRATLERYGISQEETIAFGDGGNDATMLEYCHIGVAMGNGTPEAKAAADYVTTGVDKDGIANALIHFGLID